VTDEAKAVDGTSWGQWVRVGHDRWEIVRRSWTVYLRNTHELIRLLNVPASNLGVSLQLMGDDREATAPFWEELDQRLHNLLSSAVSLVDHTRRLLKYYEPDVPTFVAEYGRRNTAVTDMNETSFLRDFRNYLLHYGAPPVVQNMDLGPMTQADTTGHSIKLSATRLLEWDKWSARSRRYLSSFGDRDGPVISIDVVAYANAMSTLFAWLFDQRRAINSDENVLNRFGIAEA